MLNQQTIEDFKKVVNELDSDIRKYYKPLETEESKFMGDGIPNAELYYKTKPKILWILKEPYLPEGDTDGYSITDTFNLPLKELIAPPIELHKSKAWEAVVYTSYAILNGLLKFDDMNYIKNEFKMMDILKKIAAINILKLSGKTSTPYDKLKEGYSKYKDILIKQIETYNPDILIFGGNDVIYIFDDYIKLSTDSQYLDCYFDAWLKNGKVYINATHPSKRTLNSEEKLIKYVEDIVEIVGIWAEKNKSHTSAI